MGPIQKAVREGGDYWENQLLGVSGDRNTLLGTHVANRLGEGSFRSAVKDELRMEMCQKYGRRWQEG